MGTGKTYSTKYLLDSNNSSGVAGQVLSTTSTGIDWVDANTVPGTGLWLANGNDIYNSNSADVVIGGTSSNYKFGVTGGNIGVSNGGNIYIGGVGADAVIGYLGNTSGVFTLRSDGNRDISIGSGTVNNSVFIEGSNGNVGIGTTSPSQKLEVNGNVLINGAAPYISIKTTQTGTPDWKIYNSYNTVGDFAIVGGSSVNNKFNIQPNGNVGIGTTSPTNYKLDVNGTVRGDSFSVEGTPARIFAPSGATYNGQGGQTGYLIVKLPDNGVSAINNMMTGVIRVFDYTYHESFDVHFAGYWYAGYNWTNTTAWIDSASYNDRNFTVSFGGMTGAAGAGTRPYIMIGEAASTWSYCKFSVINYEPGHSNYEAYKWDSGWDMNISVTNPGTTQVSVSNTQVNNWARVGQDVYYGSGTGNVGIGTTSNISSPLTVQTNGSGGALSIIGRNNGTNDEAIISFYEYDGTTRNSYIIKEAGDLGFATGTGGSATERMRITSGGNVLIGTGNVNPGQNNTSTGTQISSGGRLMIQNSGSDNIMGRNTDGVLLSFRRAGVEVGSISITTTATTYTTSSDYRLKEDLKDFAGLDMVSKIPVYDFKWKSDESRSYGVMAHELQEVLPDAVTGEKDAEEMQGVDYSKIVPFLIKAIQELKADNDSLKARIETLENN